MNANKWFSARLLRWYGHNKRDLPWRDTTDPYLIWLSEIILQQTRVEQGLPYYRRFAKEYPTVDDLADANEDAVMKAWEGLGYYSRARNLHGAAKYVKDELGSIFPSNYQELLQLKGVGPYTAAAVSSISSSEPVAVVDGNVYRVLARVFGIDSPIDSTDGKKRFQALANDLLAQESPGDHNQAVMEFGATVCTPSNPRCNTCPIADKCVALSTGSIAALPVKQGKTKVRKRYFNFFLAQHLDKVYIEKRGDNDIWRSLFQFPMIESATTINDREATDLVQKEWGMDIQATSFSRVIKHVLSHQHLLARIWKCEIPNGSRLPETWIPVKQDEINDYAMPRLLTKWLENQNLEGGKESYL